MKALLLAAGYGSRLRPITNNIPKCLVKIKGVPLLEIWLNKLISANIQSITINTHYLSEIVTKYINTSEFKSYCNLTYEASLLGTAGTLLRNINKFENDSCILIHADNYTLVDLKKFIQAHQNRPDNTLLTMMTFRTDNAESCGIVEVDSKGVVINFHEKVKNPPGNLANAAVYILSNEFLKIISYKYKNCKEFTTEILPNFLGKIYTYETSDLFIDIGTPESYQKANS